MSVERTTAIVLDGRGENALLEAMRLANAGISATGPGAMDRRDAEAIAAVFRAIAHHLDHLKCWMDVLRDEVLTIRSSSPRSEPGEKSGAASHT